MEREILMFLQNEIAGNPANRQPSSSGHIFDTVMTGFARGDDPVFQEYKSIIGPFHRTPREAFELQFRREPADITVVAWILPVSEETRASNRSQHREPSKLWVHQRYYGEKFNEELRRKLVDFFAERGIKACAPVLLDSFQIHRDRNGMLLGSNWSERHAMYAAGLGTFSLSDGFITERGIAMRCGSVVAEISLQPTMRKAGDHLSNCLFYKDGTCGKCIERCPAGAITEKGHDKDMCEEYLSKRIGPELCRRYEVTIAGCGLCQTNVPCEGRIPTSVS